MNGAYSWDPTLVVCYENESSPSAWGAVATEGKIAELGKGKLHPILKIAEMEREWKFVDSRVSKNREMKIRIVFNPYHDPKIWGILPTKTEICKVKIGHKVTLEVYLCKSASIVCIAGQQFKSSALKTDIDLINSSSGERGWFRLHLQFVFDASESGLYSFPVSCR